MEGTVNALAAPGVRLSPCSPAVLLAIHMAQALVGSVPQTEAQTEHVLHAGLYARTLRVPAGCIGVGVLIKVPTLLIVHGDCDLQNGDGLVEVRGYAVLLGEAGRKAVFVTRTAVEMTMVFPTRARTVDEAEREFTDEWDTLMSRKEQACRD